MTLKELLDKVDFDSLVPFFILNVSKGIRYDFRSVTGPYKQSDYYTTNPAKADVMEDPEVPAAHIRTHDKRLNYILESITRYQHLDLTQYDNAVICVRYSSKYPVYDAALAGFWKQVREFYGYNDIRTGTIIENSDEREVKAVLLLNKM